MTIHTPIIKRILNKNKIQSINEDELAMFVTVSHSANEINALLRASVWSDYKKEQSTAEKHGQTALKLIFLTLLAGKLNEAYDIFKKTYSTSSEISKKYYTKLQDDAKKSIKFINNYFNKNNNIRKIRTDYAFHYNPEKMVRTLPEIEEDLSVYLQKNGGKNNLYYFAETIALKSLIEECQLVSEKDPIFSLTKEIIIIAKEFAIVFGELMAVFIEINGLSEIINTSYDIVEEDLPNFDEIKIPWFTK